MPDHVQVKLQELVVKRTHVGQSSCDQVPRCLGTVLRPA